MIKTVSITIKLTTSDEGDNGGEHDDKGDDDNDGDDEDKDLKVKVNSERQRRRLDNDNDERARWSTSLKSAATWLTSTEDRT